MRGPKKEFTIMIVEDEESLRDIYEEWLRADNRRILKFESAEEALESVEVESPDLILLDIGLPGISGIDFLSAAFKGKSLADTPVVIVSGRAELSARLAGCFIYGARKFFLKPVARDELTKCVEFLEFRRGSAAWGDPALQ